MAKLTLSDLLKEILEILEKSDNELIEGIRATLRAINKEMEKFIDKLETKDGNFVNSASNSSLLLALRKKIQEIFNNSTYKKKVERFIEKFDRLEVLTMLFASKVNDVEIKGINVNAEKKEIIDQIIDGLLSEEMIKSKFGNPMRSLLFKNISNEASVSETKEALRNLVQGSNFTGQVSQIATDGISQFQGTINQRIADKYELDGFMIVGSLIKSSRDNCVEMINGSGAFKELAIRPGVYAKEDIPKIIAIASKRPGWNPATTPQTYMIYKNGYNERHAFIGIRLNDKENQTRIRKLQEAQ
jgi:hypothetical protein